MVYSVVSSRRWACLWVWAVSLMSLGLMHGGVEAVLPTAAIDVSVGGAPDLQVTLLAAQASFGVWPAMGAFQNPTWHPLRPPSDNALLCQEVPRHGKQNTAGKGVMMVPRGDCTFERKALAAQRLGAQGMILYGSLDSRYSYNASTSQVIWPQNLYDYDCSKAQALVPKSAITLDPGYNGPANDPLLTGSREDGNLCAVDNENFASSCPSQRCLLTGANTTDASMMEACCAWDLHVWLYADPTIANDTEPISIPALYITMEQATTLFDLMDQADASETLVDMVLYQCQRPSYNAASIIIWALGVFVAAVAAYLSAADYREAKHNVSQERDGGPAYTSVGSDDENRPLAEAPYRVQSSFGSQEESLDLEVHHALGFIVMASTGLLVLFFLKIYNFVKVMYAFGCAGAVVQVIFYPLYARAWIYMAGPNVHPKTICTLQCLDIGRLDVVDILATVSGYSVGLAWIIVAFVVDHPESNTFFWVAQDVFGACMCITFLSTIKLNSIKVASALLIVAFLYDIFFVFVTPLLTKGGESIMINVATSGGPPKADPSWCEKYPHDTDCLGGDPLPMLFTIPRIGDYQGGASLLGLGDIVLPGLLLSFAARFDAAKSLVGLMGGGNHGNHAGRTSSCSGGCGYYGPLVVAYAVGLMMANMAVYLMNMGQPALLYLVPCCLGTMAFLGWRRNELDQLWHGPKLLTTADSILYGNNNDPNEETRDDSPNSVILDTDTAAATPTDSAKDSPTGDTSRNQPLLNVI
mmetsp:Transcript_9476/g.17182  ORF Transcript_9476/g.17182 Transcript_9476/m.17182 type:complete len:753 (-) Transcript_9476:120-2378(-)